MEYKLSAAARASLEDIYKYTFINFGEAQADKYLSELEYVFEMLCDYPKIGRPITSRTRQFVHGKHIILYNVKSAGVVITKVVRSAQYKAR